MLPRLIRTTVLVENLERFNNACKELKMRYWGKNIEIDGSFYNTDMGKSLLPTPSEMDALKKAGNSFQYEGDAELYEITVQNMMREVEKNQVGTILMLALEQSPRTLRIIPLTSKEQGVGKIPCANPVGGFNPKGNECYVSERGK
jgi:hypothetical protein